MTKKNGDKRSAVRIREPIGLRVLLRAVRPDDHEPCLVWRAEREGEAAELIERGKAEDWATLGGHCCAGAKRNE